MFRLFSALPRPHKFLMVPILSMVTVLGVHTYQQHQALSATDKQHDPFNAVPAPPPSGNDTPTSALLSSGSQTTVDTTSVQLLTSLLQPGAASVKDASGMTPFHQRFLTALTSGSDADFSDELPYDDESLGSHESLDQGTAPASSNDSLRWLSYTVQQGDSFSSIAAQSLGLDATKVSALLNGLPDAATRRSLTQLREGMSIDYQIDHRNQLASLRVMQSAKNGLLLTREDSGRYTYTRIHRNVEPLQRIYAGTVRGNFGQSAQASGLSHSDINEVTRALSRKLNFRTQSHSGDHFQVLVETDTLDGKTLGSRVLAVQYQGRAATMTLVRYNDSFYTPDGHGLDPSFNRYPFLGHFAITSPFNLARLHPVTHRICPHHGTDFGMPVGTPLKSPSVGVVTQVAYNPYAGHYMVIDHGDGIKTRYLHLYRSLVHPGEHVKMGTTIALSGSSGRVTGPHLHYEVLINNRAVDSMRVKLPNGQQLAGAQLASFKRQTQNFIARLAAPDSDRAYAQNSGSARTSDIGHSKGS